MGVYAYSLLCQQFTLRLRADLSRWWLLQSLPLSKPDLLFAELVLPWGLTTALGWLAVLAVDTGPFFPGAILIVLLPPVTAALGFIAAADLLRQSKTALLMQGLPARHSELALIVGALCAAAPFGLLWFNRTTLLLGGVLAFAFACLLAYLAFQVAVYFYQNIE